MDYKALNGICEEYARKAVEWRRDLHRYPEPAWTEFRTTAFLAKTLEEAGVPVLMGKQVVCPEYAMGYPEESVIKAAMERAVAQGARMPPALLCGRSAGQCAPSSTTAARTTISGCP